MHVGALAPVGIFVLLASAVSVRLLVQWRRTRGLPELCIGAGLACLAFLGMPLTALGRLPALMTTPPGRALFVLGMAACCFGIFLLYLFTWVVFRRESAWARVLLGCVGALLLGSWLGASMANLEGETPAAMMAGARGFNLIVIALVSMCFVWTGLESTMYYGDSRRRCALGLSDPVVVNRFLLWATGSWASAALCAGLFAAAARGVVIAADPRALYGIAAAGLVMSASWYLTFFAPEGYRRWITGRAEYGGGMPIHEERA